MLVRKMFIGLLLLCITSILMTSCSDKAEPNEDEYLTKMNEYVDAYERIADGYSINASTTEEVINQFSDYADETNALYREFKKLNPPEKFKSDHEQLVLMFQYFNESFEDMVAGAKLANEGKKDAKLEIKYKDDIDKAHNIYNQSPLLKDPYRKSQIKD